VERLPAEATERARSQFATRKDLEEAKRMNELVCQEEGVSPKEFFSGSHTGPVPITRAKPAQPRVRQ